MNQLLVSFLTGLTTGGLSCFAIQGGLIAGVIANQSENERKKSLITFLTSKLIAHFILGGLLGFVGSTLILNSNIQGTMQIVSGIFILLMALKISSIHPFFRNFSITTPKFVYRYIRKESKTGNSVAPILIGLLTILIPCGVTQAMMILSVSSSSFWYGSFLLGSFILGTTPIFYALGMASEKILSIKSFKFIAVILMLYLGLSSVNGGLVLKGSVHTFQNYKAVIISANKNESKLNITENGKQIVTITVKNSGYEASTNTLKIGIPAKLILKTDNTFGCSRSFTIPSYNISKLLPTTGTETIDFTPNKLGILTFTCSMGMYTGSFNVVE